MNIKDIIDSISTDIKDGEIITRKWKNGKIIHEEKEQFDWEPNAADLDIVLVGCECGNQYDIPCDCLQFLNSEGSFCGQCGKSGKMRVISNPSPNKK